MKIEEKIEELKQDIIRLTTGMELISNDIEKLQEQIENIYWFIEEEEDKNDLSMV